jgi:serine/threonine protein kinase
MPNAARLPPSKSTPSAALPGLSGQTLPSGLVVLSRLCESAEGRLYAAIAPSRKEVTLLVLSSEGQAPSQDGPDLVARVRQRAREERLDKVKAIHHPNIAEIYGTDVAPDGTPCLVIEPFSGEPLSGILATRGAVPLSAAIDLSLQAAAGLTAAHAAGVVHGNVSPETMLLTRTADGHRLKLIGFSLGLFGGGSRNGGLENARYVSLEQRSGGVADDQSDVYSLAAVLHHLVSGAPPEAGGVVAESIPRRLKAVLEKALADRRSDRYSTMAAFAAALERASGPDDVQEEVRGGRSRLVGLATAIAVVAGVWLLWGSRQAGMRAEAEARTAVPSDSVVFGPVEGGVSYAEAPKPTAKTDTAITTLTMEKVEPAKKTERTKTERVRPSVSKMESPKTAKATPPRLVAIAPAKTESQQRMSPFRQSHPWVAYPQGRFYYPSNCSETLKFDDLVYFATEKEAQAAGFLPSRSSRCP